MIEVSHLSVNYGPVEAVRDVSFTIQPGEICGYLGPNGAGKSSTVKSITGILQPAEGRVKVLGHDMADRPVQAQRHLGYVPENAAAYSLLTVSEYLGLVGELYEMDPALAAERIGRLVESFGLARHAHALIDSLSKGQRQKVVLSSALLHDPQVLIFDEPLSGLDANAARLVKEILQEKAQRGCTILFCSHMLEIVERLCHRTIILNQGRVVADAPTSELVSLSRERTLEGVFRDLTMSIDEADAARELVSALAGPAPATPHGDGAGGAHRKGKKTPK